MFFINSGKNKGKMIEISKELIRLKNIEPPSSDSKKIMRTAIMGYELGAVQQFAIRNASDKLDQQIKKGYEANAKLGIADLVIQLRLFCLDNYWNFDEIQNLGLNHLKERHKDFKSDGWGEE